ncbi:MAG: hypothetical protein ABIO70_26130 [Pseudomonadota bacterium]
MVLCSCITLAALIPTSAGALATAPAAEPTALQQQLAHVERQEPAGDPAAPGTESGKKRDYLMEINFRGRYYQLPDGIIDIWYFDEGDPGVTLDRPKARAWGTGLEWWAKWDSGGSFTVFFDYMGNLIQPGYWDDVEEPANHTDGEYLVPERLGIIDFGIGGGYEAKMTPWMGFMFWGGLGPLFMTGEWEHWVHGSTATGDPLCSQGDTSLLPNGPDAATAYERYDAGCGSDGPKRIPSVLGVVDLVAALRFNFNDRANLRIEGGLHDMPFVGLSTGVVF